MSMDLNAQGDVNIGGDVVARDKIIHDNDQVAVGQYVLQIGTVNGGTVNIQPEQQPTLRPRPAPVLLRPRPFANLIGREDEIKTAVEAARSALPLEFYGEPGLGKTALLRKLAYPDALDAFPDGVVHLSALHQPLPDLLQSLFDAFFESDPPTKVTDAEVRHGLQGKRALILLDDVEITREEVEALLNAAPACTFVLASDERRLWGEGRAVALRGLPPDDGVQLMERELGKDLSQPEEQVAERICTALDGNPLHILQAAALVRDQNQPLDAVADQVVKQVEAEPPAEGGAASGAGQPAAAKENVQVQAVAALSEAELKILQALAALNGAPVNVQHLADITDIQNAGEILENLKQRGLVQAHSPRYSLAGRLAEILRRRYDLTAAAEIALAHFVRWAEANRRSLPAMAEATLPMRAILGWAAARPERAPEAVRLARAMELNLVYRGKWAQWRGVMQIALDAARSAGDRAAEAYALHQLGSQALCLGDKPLAQTLLQKALDIRNAIGDAGGAAASAHNLQVLRFAPLPRPARWARLTQLAAQPQALAGAAAIAVVAAVAALAALIGPALSPAPTPTATPTLVPTAVPSPTPLPPTLTPEPTLTPSASDSATWTPLPTETPTITGTPTDTPTITHTPTATRRPRITFTPSRTPPPPTAALSSATPLPPVRISFSADAAAVPEGQCTTLRWSAGPAEAVYLYGGEFGGPPGVGVVGDDARTACPAPPSTTYTLRAVRGAEVHERSVTISVLATPTPEADTVPPPAPALISPINNVFFTCGSGPTLNWSAVGDPSGIDHYDWTLEYSGDNVTYDFYAAGSAANTSATLPGLGCGYYRWRVRAVDGAGNAGDYSSYGYFGETIG
jgi:hypothetical protein